MVSGDTSRTVYIAFRVVTILAPPVSTTVEPSATLRKGVWCTKCFTVYFIRHDVVYRPSADSAANVQLRAAAVRDAKGVNRYRRTRYGGQLGVTSRKSSGNTCKGPRPSAKKLYSILFPALSYLFVGGHEVVRDTLHRSADVIKHVHKGVVCLFGP
ncbi:hypothetical protein GH714_044126 [Hevea brasiliensis]|uniref:Uncharacterized protein n=1 Tax=Hevea brasiliensis TaxID=3981 RepID=A0A6A6K0F4_HEVBR|nr:hypothetical protein GH714_044126 [Hevea brasiliensis]